MNDSSSRSRCEGWPRAGATTSIAGRPQNRVPNGAFRAISPKERVDVAGGGSLISPEPVRAGSTVIANRRVSWRRELRRSRVRGSFLSRAGFGWPPYQTVSRASGSRTGSLHLHFNDEHRPLVLIAGGKAARLHRPENRGSHGCRIPWLGPRAPAPARRARYRAGSIDRRGRGTSTPRATRCWSG